MRIKLEIYALLRDLKPHSAEELAVISHRYGHALDRLRDEWNCSIKTWQDAKNQLGMYRLQYAVKVLDRSLEGEGIYPEVILKKVREKLAKPVEAEEDLPVVGQVYKVLSDLEWHQASELAAVTPRFSDSLFKLRKRGCDIELQKRIDLSQPAVYRLVKRVADLDSLYTSSDSNAVQLSLFA